MNVYIAGPNAGRRTAIGVMHLLEAHGHTVTSTWLRQLDELDDAHARLDLADVDRADALVALNFKAWQHLGSGGRYVEFGYAIARGKRLIVVGERSNIFHYLSDVVLVAHAAEIAPALAAMTVPA